MNQDGEMKRETNETVVVDDEEEQEIRKQTVDDDDPTGDIIIDIDGDDLIFSVDDTFPTLPDFPCLSSPSASPTPSSASNLPKNPSISISSSSSSSSSWSFLAAGPGQAQEPHMQTATVHTTADSDDIFGDIELWDPSNPLDPSFLFPDDYDTALEAPAPPTGDDDGGANPSEDLAGIFLDWLKNNRDSISPEDLRSIKLKRSTIECAAARLGGGKQGRTQLLKLILAWVQNHHLQKKKRRLLASQEQETAAAAGQFYNYHPAATTYPQYQFPNPNPNPSLDYNCEPWNVHYPVENAIPVPALPAMMISDATPAVAPPLSPLPTDFHLFSPPPGTIHYSPFPGLGLPCPHPVQQYPAGYGSQYPMYPGSSLIGSASATKEARKKRMARQRRVSALHQHRNNQSHNRQHVGSTAAGGREKATARNGSTEGGSSSSKNWAFLSSARQKNLLTDASAVTATLPATSQSQSRNGSSSDKRQGWKSEKNLRFLLQKVLKQSDVGSLGRIVLPKVSDPLHGLIS